MKKRSMPFLLIIALVVAVFIFGSILNVPPLLTRIAGAIIIYLGLVLAYFQISISPGAPSPPPPPTRSALLRALEGRTDIIVDFVEQQTALFAGSFLFLLGIPIIIINQLINNTTLTIFGAGVMGVGFLCVVFALKSRIHTQAH